MTPPAGRPPKKDGEEDFARHRGFRLTDRIMKMMDECQKALGFKSRTEVVEYSIKKLHDSVVTKKEQ